MAAKFLDRYNKYISKQHQKQLKLDVKIKASKLSSHDLGRLP